MSSKEGAEFKVETFISHLETEILEIDPRILTVERVHDCGKNEVVFLLQVASEEVEFSIFIVYKPEEDSFSICSPLRNDADEHPQEGIDRICQWWEEYEENLDDGLLIDFGRDDKLLLLYYEDMASAFYVEAVGDFVVELLDTVPHAVRKLQEVLGENPRTSS